MRNFTTDKVLRSLWRLVLATGVAGLILSLVVSGVGLWEAWRWQRGDYDSAEIASAETDDENYVGAVDIGIDGLVDGLVEGLGDEESVQLSEVHDLVTASLLEEEKREEQEEVKAGVPQEVNLPTSFREQAWWREGRAVAAGLSTKPRIVIVLDDLGLQGQPRQAVLDLPAPMTLSFLSHAPNLVGSAELARAHGHEVLLHVPMEPKGAQDPGPHALRSGDSLALRRANVRRHLAFAREMGAVGVNNHMGSRATEDRVLMGQLLEELGARGLLFLDSRTTAGSVAPAEALRRRVAFAERDIFLDHELRAEAIEGQLAQVEMLARAQGYAIAIGHPHRATLSVLSNWAAGLEGRGFMLVPLSVVVAEAGGYLPRARGLR